MLRRRIKQILGLPLWLRLKDMLYRPRGVAMGPHSYIFRPFAINQRSRLTLGERCEILSDSYIWTQKTSSAEIRVADATYIGRHFYATAIHSILIGKRCVLSDYVYITDCSHGLDPHGDFILHQPLESKGPVEIGDGCFLGFRAVILPGVTLGAHCVVGANAVVTRSFPAYSMVAGAPARVIKTYSIELKQWLAVDHQA
ncbi:MAG: acyltransferase [Acidobacteriaceae bacterium]|nr:acyltransferase [Acidobacteriaceae bacterium]